MRKSPHGKAKALALASLTRSDPHADDAHAELFRTDRTLSAMPSETARAQPSIDCVDQRDFLDGMSDLAQSVAPDGQIRFVNRAWRERLGYTEADVAHMNIFEVIDPESQDHCRHYLGRLASGEDVGPMEVVFRTKQGEPVNLEGRVTMRFEDGVPVSTRGIFREATASRRQDAAFARLREQRRLFHSVLAILRANAGRNREEFLELATRKTAQALAVSRVGVWLFDERRERIVCEHLFANGEPHGRTGQVLLRSAHRAYFEAIESHLPVRADDARTHLATATFAESYLLPNGITSMLDAPIRIGDQIAGILCCEHTAEPRRWTNDEEEFATAVSALVLLYLENEKRVRAERDLQQMNEHLERLVTERTAELDRSEQRLNYLLNASSAVIYTCKAGGDFSRTYISPNIEALLGYSARHFIEDPRFWSARIHPDDIDGAYAALRETVARGSSEYEYRFRTSDEHFRWIRDEYVLLRDELGAPTEIVGSVTDIDDLRRAENAARAAANDLRRLIDTANAPIFGKDIHHRVNEWNRCAEQLTGYSKDEVLGRSLTEHIAPDYQHAVREVLDLALVGVETANFEFPLIAKDGRHVVVLLNASTRRDANGEICGMVGVGQDITERREAEVRSLRAQRLESIGTLASGVAHDVNNALAPILLATGLFRKQHPESAHLIDVMESSARRGASMVKQLLTFAKGVEGQRASVQSCALIKELEQIVTSTFPKNITLQVRCLAELPPVLGDATQLHQVLLNLCVNARDAMPDGGTLVLDANRAVVSAADARAHGDCAAGEYVVWRVSDSGSGIAQDLVERIFEPFFSTNSPERGTGLGLSTAVGIVRSHGGFMRVRSRPGAGSTFYVYLPAGTDGIESVAAACPRDAFRGRGERILVVDDEPAVRDVLRQILVSLGCSVRTSKDGMEALAVLAEPTSKIDGVITDLHMPRMDGIELTRAIRRTYDGLGVILASGRFEKNDQRKLEALGVVALLEKPFSFESLGEALKSMLAKRQA